MSNRVVLFQDFTIVIERQPDTNIICVCWLEQQVFRMSDFEYSFHNLMENIEKFGTKKLLAQSSRSMIHLPEEQFTSVILLLQSGLAHSKIEKVARISSDNSPEDMKCIKYFEHIINEMQLEIDFKNFDKRKEALAWLSGSSAAA